MTTAATAPLRDFNIGSRGITGHYDTMLGKLRDGTPRAAVVVVLWAWVASWPSETTILDLGPVLNLALVIKLGLLVWTARVFLPILHGFWYGWRWRNLEARGLQTILRNDHRIRVVYYRQSDNSFLFDETTEQDRVAEEFQVNHARKAAMASAFQQVCVAGLIFLAIPTCLVLFPILTHIRLDWAVQPFDVDAMAARASAHPRLADWLNRLDVHAILGALSIEGLILWWITLGKVVPAISGLFWLMFDGAVHRAGSQYVPGAKVLERKIAQRTTEDMRQQHVHGHAGESSAADAARRMAE